MGLYYEPMTVFALFFPQDLFSVRASAQCMGGTKCRVAEKKVASYLHEVIQEVKIANKSRPHKTNIKFKTDPQQYSSYH